MKLISHRGNTKGKDLMNENNPNYLMKTLNLGYDVELDLWVYKNELFLGHDEGVHPIKIDWLISISTKSWVHCKNLEALTLLSNYKEINYFFHNNDDYVLTSKGYIWSFPNSRINEKCVCVLPERNKKIINVLGVCSDFIDDYKNILI